MHVAQIRREHRKERIDRTTAPIAVHERADGEAMPEIMEARKAATVPVATKSWAHADLGGHPCKGVLGGVLRDADAALGDKQRLIEAVPDDSIPDGLIRHQPSYR